MVTVRKKRPLIRTGLLMMREPRRTGFSVYSRRWLEDCLVAPVEVVCRSSSTAVPGSIAAHGV